MISQVYLNWSIENVDILRVAEHKTYILVVKSCILNKKFPTFL